MAIRQSDIRDPAIRRELGRKSLYYFAMIYFPRFFRSLIPDFHRRWYKLMEFRTPNGSKPFTYLALIAFRESAKTSLAKIKIVRDIVYRRRKLISYICYEKDAAREALFDIATWLQTNELLIADFGNLFYAKEVENQAQQKTLPNFVANGVRIKARAIRQTTRGGVFDVDRPDCYVIDDFENNITKKSSLLTRKAIDFLKELMTGISADAEVIFLCNKISDTGSVQWLLDSAYENPDFIVEDVPVLINGKSAWPDKFVLTDAERDERNANIQDSKRWVKSLESLKRTMNADGSKTFEQEMLNQPLVEGDRFFNVEAIDRRIAEIKQTPWQSANSEMPNYSVQEGSWKRWGLTKKKPGERWAISADVAEGYGNDSSVIQVFNLTTCEQIAEYESNECPPDILAALMVQEGKAADGCILAPERNSIGVAVVNEIRRLEYTEIYRQKTIDRTSNKPVHKFGWWTGSNTKPTMLFEFKRDFEAGLIKINSLPLLREMRSFTNNDIPFKNFDPEASNHFDRLIAICIAWQMRNVSQIKGFL